MAKEREHVTAVVSTATIRENALSHRASAAADVSALVTKRTVARLCQYQSTRIQVMSPQRPVNVLTC